LTLPWPNVTQQVDDEVLDETEDEDDAGGLGGATSTTAGGATFAGSATLPASSAIEAGTAAANGSGESRRFVGKSVRMAEDKAGPGDGGEEEEEEEEEEGGGDEGKGRRRRGRGRGSATGEGVGSRRSAAAAAAGEAGEKRATKTLTQRVQRFLLGWMASAVKLNGKKLLPSNAAIVRLMAPLLLWAVMVLVVFGVSYAQLQGLQAPLSSLNGASFVWSRLGRPAPFMPIVPLTCMQDTPVHTSQQASSAPHPSSSPPPNNAQPLRT
jgi:hypothetical protein